ncbi:MAG TPA: XTP/dITP diphosphatase [bacterium]|nr:XTP/dITP diphosphatase [bacterium]HPN44817.1 XTP/dITP diphosphatase [bacterium]
MNNKTLLLATKNKDKITEISQLFANLPITLVTARDLTDLPRVEEDGDTLEANAIKKATEYSRATGLPAIADDTGLEVDALNGEPGVNSARYAGEHATYNDNVQKLLQAMQGVKPAARTARFKTVIAFVNGDVIETVTGQCEGVIIEYPSGGQGFGYDPVFYVPEYDRTFAEMDVELKNQISHRGRALVKIKDYLEKNFINS